MECLASELADILGKLLTGKRKRNTVWDDEEPVHPLETLNLRSTYLLSGWLLGAQYQH